MKSDSFDGLPPNFAAVSDALQAFVNVPFQGKRAILEREQHLLLTDVADYLATKLIRMNINSNEPDAQRTADYIEAHRNMLRRCREFGISAVWSEFEARSRAQEHLPRDGDPQSILLAFMAFDNAPFSQERLVLEQEQRHLLTDTAEQLLVNLIGEAEQRDGADKLNAVKHWKALRYLLRQARKTGIAVAWEELEARENMLARIEQEADLVELRDTILALATVPSQNLREMLEREQHLLLTDSAEQLIDVFIQQAQQSDEFDFANNLTTMRILIHRAREIGIDATFKEIEEVDISLVAGLTPSDLLPVLSAVQKFVFAYEPEEIRSALERYRDVLLSDTAERVLKQHILDAKRQGQDQHWIEHLERHLVLLRTMRNSGVEATLAIMNTVSRRDKTSLGVRQVQRILMIS